MIQKLSPVKGRSCISVRLYLPYWSFPELHHVV